MLKALRRAVIVWLGGFPDTWSAIRHIREIDDADSKAFVLSEAVKHLYHAIGADDILHQEKNGIWLFRGKPLTSVEVSQLREEANYLRGMKLWHVIKLDIRYQLGKKMFEDARVKDDIVWGQLLTYLDDIVRTRLQNMK